MTVGKGKKHIMLFLCVFVLLCAVAVVCFLFDLRKKINDLGRFQSYRLQYTQDAAQEADFLKQLCRDKRGVKLYKASGRSHLYLRLGLGEEEAESYGLSISTLEEKGFLVAYQGNALCLFAGTQDGLRRGCYYMVYNLVDENGRLLLNPGERYVDKGRGVREQICIGDVPIEEYSIVSAENVPAIYVLDLRYYINQAGGGLPDIGEGEAHIRLEIDEALSPGKQEIEAAGGNITIKGADETALAKGISQFANTYLGWMYAGTERETLEGGDSLPIRIPAEIQTAKNPWMEEREAIITLWKVNYPGGVFQNNATSLKNDVMSFSEEQLYEYVRMLKYCGFTGIQATDICSAWAGAGGYEYVQERLRILADAAHSMGMKFTLWVWGAEFNMFGWVDASVTYEAGGYASASENPAVQAAFEKYYSIYAELADCTDRLIVHYYEPGNLEDRADAAYFAEKLVEKFRAVNPDIDFGINCWANYFSLGDMQEFINRLGNDITMYEGGYHSDPETYVPFRSFCVQNGCRLGTWAWNTCDREIDQLAQMCFTPHMIKSVYQTAGQYDEIKKPEYWSEMDSYHVLNVFSLYCAGQLLIDPSLEPEQLTYDVALATVGEEYAADFAKVLRLIEKARSGESWDTYWWDSDDFILKSAAYPAEEILTESKEAIELLEEMIERKQEANTLPLPIKLEELLRLLLPHLKQMSAFAKFRLEFANVENMLISGASSEKIQAKLKVIGEPIPEYNTIIGLWGQLEARAQQEMLFDFCQRNGLEMPIYPAYDRERKFRIYSQLARKQRGKPEPVLFYSPTYEGGLAYGQETTDRLVRELIEEGILVEKEGTDALYLADWERYSTIFN